MQSSGRKQFSLYIERWSRLVQGKTALLLMSRRSVSQIWQSACSKCLTCPSAQLSAYLTGVRLNLASAQGTLLQLPLSRLRQTKGASVKHMLVSKLTLQLTVLQLTLQLLCLLHQSLTARAAIATT